MVTPITTNHRRLCPCPALSPSPLGFSTAAEAEQRGHPRLSALSPSPLSSDLTALLTVHCSSFTATLWPTPQQNNPPARSFHTMAAGIHPPFGAPPSSPFTPPIHAPTPVSIPRPFLVSFPHRLNFSTRRPRGRLRVNQGTARARIQSRQDE